MDLLDLYKEENNDLLYCISWLNKNSIFDKSIGRFKDIDLFTFLENINNFDYANDTFFDDVYYILEYTQDSILHLINNINKEIKREHKIVPISQAREFDKKSVIWISKQNGRTLKEKLSNGKIKSVQRYKNIDTYENRIFKKFLISLLKVYEKRNDLSKFEELFFKIHNWLRSDDSKNIDEYGKIVYNNILLHHPNYSKIFKSYKWLYGLSEKLKNYTNLNNVPIKQIIKFEVLTQLQLYTKLNVLPSLLNFKREDFAINLKNPLLDINLDNILIPTYKKYFQNQKSITSIRNFIISELKSIITEDRTFKIKIDFDEVFIDLFRLFPVARINSKIINFPITLKQKIDEKIINANNTKIIDLNHEIHTLPEILDTFNIEILKYFLEDFSKIFNKAKLNYIIPDYVNVFEFTDSKRMINSYFKNTKPIPKSILTGLQYLFSNNAKKDDTLIYIQRNHHNELYVTPLLVKYDNKLKDITNGYYLERYPTKKIGIIDDGLLKSLNDIFDEESSKILLNKFLQNGLKGIKKESIVFYQDENIIDLSSLEIPLKVYDDIEKIKSLYTTKNLFKSNYKYLNDTNEENLINFEKLLQYEKQDYNLWREHLPDLSMEIVKNGVYEQFTLVNETSELIEKTVKIENHFLIPYGVKELSFPLTFGDEKINYKAYLSSKDFPYTQNIECLLNLTYDYERENPYELIFKPLNKEYKEINVEWKQQSYNDIELPIPNYPEKKSWEEFTRDPKRDGSGYSDLLDWILERVALLENIDEVPQFYIENEQKKKEGYFENWGGTDRNNQPYCFVNVNGESIFCHSNFFQYKNFDYTNVKQGDKVFLDIKYNKIRNNYIGSNIVFAENMENCLELLRIDYGNKTIDQKVKPIIKAIKSIKYPLLTVWNNHSLSDVDTPDYFRELMLTYINLSLSYMSNKNLPIDFKKELFNFLSHLHQDMPIQIANTLVKYSTDLQYSNNLALSIGNSNLEWQEKILKNIFNHFNKHKNVERVFDILAIALWRSETLINKISQENIEKIIYNLISIMKKDFISLTQENNNRNIGKLVKKLELLLGILRARNNFDFLYPHEALTLQYIETLDKIIKYTIDNKINIKTRIQLDIDKPESFNNVPNILYALRVYLTSDTGAANSIKVLGVSDD